MKDITSKPETLRTATAQAVLESAPEHIRLLAERRTEKGDAIEAARVAGMMAAKRTWELIPLCHQIPLSSVSVDFEFANDRVTIIAHVRLIASTGAEMEALTAASVAALTLYDMLKPHAGTHITIGDTRLVEKTGGKSHYRRSLEGPARAGVIVLSDSVSAGTARDSSGLHARRRLEEAGFEVAAPVVLPDEPDQLEKVLRDMAGQCQFVLTVGGTGLSARDTTVETVKALLERELPGIAETARAHGQRRMPYAMLSRAVAGTIGNTLIITAPGSPGGVDEYLDALMPGIVHALKVIGGHKHGHPGARPTDARH